MNLNEYNCLPDLFFNQIKTGDKACGKVGRGQVLVKYEENKGGEDLEIFSKAEKIKNLRY